MNVMIARYALSCWAQFCSVVWVITWCYGARIYLHDVHDVDSHGQQPGCKRVFSFFPNS